MATANKLYFDAAVRHQVAVRRYASGEVNDVLKYLEGADRELTARLRERLAALTAAGKPADFTSRRWKALLTDIKAARKETIAHVKKNVTGNLQEFARNEHDNEIEMLKSAIPIEVGFASVDLRQLRAIVTTHPFAGHPLGDWFSGLAAADQSSLVGAIRMGMVQGESIPNIMRRVAGTEANLWRDGALAATRRKTEAVVRTAVNSVSNEARNAVWEENSDIISALRWTSTLDGRTTPICMKRDGQLVAIGGRDLPLDTPMEQILIPPAARPPAHVNCRSVMVAVIDGVGVLGNRPFVRDTRRPEAREVDFRTEAKRTGRPIADIRKEWADKNIGQVPAKTTYNDWLRDQPAAFQDEVLGPSRAEIFRQGKVTVDQFVDSRGKFMTLKDLADKRGIEVPKDVKLPRGSEVLASLREQFPDIKNLRDYHALGRSPTKGFLDTREGQVAIDETDEQYEKRVAEGMEREASFRQAVERAIEVPKEQQANIQLQLPGRDFTPEELARNKRNIAVGLNPLSAPPSGLALTAEQKQCTEEARQWLNRHTSRALTSRNPNYKADITKMAPAIDDRRAFHLDTGPESSEVSMSQKRWDELLTGGHKNPDGSPHWSAIENAKDSWKTTLSHEMGHGYEHAYDKKGAVRQYLLDKAKNPDGSFRDINPLNHIANGSGYGSHEIGFEKMMRGDGGRFGNEYWSKVYSSNKNLRELRDAAKAGTLVKDDLTATEVLSMMMQSLYSDPTLLYVGDPDSFAFVVDFLRGHV